MGKKQFSSSAAKQHFIDCLNTGFRHILSECRKYHRNHRWAVEERDRLIFGDRITTAPGDWEKLSQLDQAALFGYWDALVDSLTAELEYRYRVDEAWYTQQDVIDGKIEPTFGCYVHIVKDENGEVKYYPW